MELPKNITQIGEVNPRCKIYVEDYAISYLKQLNQCAGDKELAVALYGIRKEEGEVTYLFLYGACRLVFLQKECRHLSQAVWQEIEKQRKRYFSQYIFLGYRMLNGEMIEGFHICEQSVCRYVEGYARFYEKNDSMLAFMLEERQGEAKPEKVDQGKYDMVKKRQEERRTQAEETGGHAFSRILKPLQESGAVPTDGNGRLRNMKLTAAAAFILLCGIGLATVGDGERWGNLRLAAEQMMNSLTQRQLPDVMEANGTAQVGTVVAEDRLTDAILKENAAAGMQEDGQAPGQESNQETDTPDTEEGTSPGAESQAVPKPDQQTAEPEQNQQTPPESDQQTPSEPEPQTTQESNSSPEPDQQTVAEPAVELVSYTVQKGDTLIGICIRKYGSDDKVAEICSLNNISNPDDIKEGEKIFIPQ